MLPVMVRNTPLEDVPPYLRAVSILEPVGNIAAETSSAVHNMRPPKRRSDKLLVRYGLGVFLCVVAIGSIAYFVSEKAESVRQELIVNCESVVPRPWKARKDKTIYIVQIGSNKSPAFNSAVGPGEGELKLKGIFPLWMGKCEIINYSSTNLFRVSFDLNINWQSVVKTDGRTTNGEVIASATSVSPEFDLSADGTNNSVIHRGMGWVGGAGIPEAIPP